MYNKEQVEEGLRNLFNEAFEITPTDDNCEIVYYEDNLCAGIVVEVDLNTDTYKKVNNFLEDLGNIIFKSTHEWGGKLHLFVKVCVPFVNWGKYTA